MTSITFLASSRPFILPKEIEEYNAQTKFEVEKDYMTFSLEEVNPFWRKQIFDLFSMPYLYEVEGAGNRLFLLYLEKYMEEGDVFELYHLPNQHTFKKYIEEAKENSNFIEVNSGSFIYKDASGSYQFNSKTWIEELSHRKYITHRCITRFVKYRDGQTNFK